MVQVTTSSAAAVGGSPTTAVKNLFLVHGKPIRFYLSPARIFPRREEYRKKIEDHGGLVGEELSGHIIPLVPRDASTDSLPAHSVGWYAAEYIDACLNRGVRIPLRDWDIQKIKQTHTTTGSTLVTPQHGDESPNEESQHLPQTQADTTLTPSHDLHHSMLSQPFETSHHDMLSISMGGHDTTTPQVLHSHTTTASSSSRKIHSTTSHVPLNSLSSMTSPSSKTSIMMSPTSSTVPPSSSWKSNEMMIQQRDSPHHHHHHVLVHRDDDHEVLMGPGYTMYGTIPHHVPNYTSTSSSGAVTLLGSPTMRQSNETLPSSSRPTTSTTTMGGAGSEQDDESGNGHSQRMRGAFTEEEDRKIVDYIGSRSNASIHGNRLYVEMEMKGIVQRSWQSIKNRYLRYILGVKPKPNSKRTQLSTVTSTARAQHEATTTAASLMNSTMMTTNRGPHHSHSKLHHVIYRPDLGSNSSLQTSSSKGLMEMAAGITMPNDLGAMTTATGAAGLETGTISNRDMNRTDYETLMNANMKLSSGGGHGGVPLVTPSSMPNMTGQGDIAGGTDFGLLMQHVAQFCEHNGLSESVFWHYVYACNGNFSQAIDYLQGKSIPERPWTGEEDRILLSTDREAIRQLRESRGSDMVRKRTLFLNQL